MCGVVWRGTWRDVSYHLCNQTEILMFFFMCVFRFLFKLEVFSTNVKMWQMCGAAGQGVHTRGDASYDCNPTPNTQPHPSSVLCS